jgi:hypothetical protein
MSVKLQWKARASIGCRYGNSAVLSPGIKLGDDVLVGVLSKMKEEDLPVKDGTSWFGSPAVFLPRRDINHDFSSERTYKPTKKLFFYRYFIEFSELSCHQHSLFSWLVLSPILLLICRFREILVNSYYGFLYSISAYR